MIYNYHKTRRLEDTKFVTKTILCKEIFRITQMQDETNKHSCQQYDECSIKP